MGCVAAGLAISAPAWAADDWETVLLSPYVVKTRDVQGSGVKEYLVEGKLDAPAAALEATLCDTRSFPSFMPHVKEARVLHEGRHVDHVYVRVEPPVGSSRDYVSEVRLLESVDTDGRFRQAWRALPRLLPERSGVIRLQVNEGSWLITPLEDGGSRVVYRFKVDPGGWVPAFIQDLANKEAIPQTLRAIEQEAQRRGRSE